MDQFRIYVWDIECFLECILLDASTVSQILKLGRSLLLDVVSVQLTEKKYMVNSPHKEIGGTYEDCRRADKACQT